MNDENLGGTPAESTEYDDFDTAWLKFGQRLGHYLGQMTAPDEADHLIVEVPGECTDAGTTPYAQFAAFSGGTQIRAEISGDVYLSPIYQCARDAIVMMKNLGWQGNDGPEGNWHMEIEVDRAVELARLVVTSMRECFGIAHPELMTYRAWGPAASAADALGLEATESIATEANADDFLRPAFEPQSREHLIALVASTLEELHGEAVPVDDDEDFVLEGPGQPIWVRVRQDAPWVEIMAIATYDVRSRSHAAVEVSLLNRDGGLVRWSLRDDRIWQSIIFPAAPFAPVHLIDLLEIFGNALSATRGDLALRVGGKVIG